jgi:hypothetical protein
LWYNEKKFRRLKMRKRNKVVFLVLLIFLILLNLVQPKFEKIKSYISQVVLSPNQSLVANSFAISVVLESEMVVADGTPIQITFDEGFGQSDKISIPDAFPSGCITISVSSNNITKEYSATSISSFNPGSTTSKGIQFVIAQGFPTLFGSVTPPDSFIINIKTGANIVPLTTGEHTVSVTIGSVVFNYTFTISSQGGGGTGSPISISSILIGNPKLGVTSAFTFVFASSYNLTNSDSITIEFPANFVVPQVIDGRNFSLSQGNTILSDFSGFVSISGNRITLTIPSSPYINFSSGYSMTLKLSAYTGIVNPSATGNYTFKMYTSKQTTPANYTVTLGTSITNLFWNASQTAAYAYSQHNISFATSSTGALTTSDTITVQFPTGFTLPTLIPQGSVLVNNTIAKASVSSNSLVITCPVSIGNSSQVSIKITTDAKIQNPPSSQTGYKIKVFTSEDPLPFESQAILFNPSIIQNVKVTVSPAVINKSASISVEFVLGMGGALSSSDSIYIVFPVQFTLPSSIANNLVSIIYNNNTYNPSGITITIGTGTVALALPSNLSILAGSSLKVIFDANANITTPAQPNSYKLKVSTSKETTQVDSLAFDIFAYPKSSIVVSPTSPDGQNGYYITQPTITFAVGDIMGATITAYYKMGDTDTYKTYDLVNKPSIKMPEGTTTVYFYAQDNFGNKEPENSKTILVDLTDPVMSITDPKENSVVVQPTFTIKGSVKSIDIANTSLFVAGKSVTLNSDGTFEALVTLPNEGVNTITLQAKSPSGRTSTKQFAVNYIARVTVFLQVGNDNAYINGEQVAIDAPPFIAGGNVMVPLRFILTSFKANLDWDNIFQIITLTLGNNRMRLQIGNLRADVNGQLKMLPTVPVLVKGVTFVPLRFISENFGADVKWDPTLKAVSIVYPKP